MMKRSSSKHVAKSNLAGSSSESDLRIPIPSNRIIKKKLKKQSSKLSESLSTHKRSDSEHDRSTSLAGLSSSFSLSTFPEKDTDKSSVETPVITKSKAIDRDISAEKELTKLASTSKHKNKKERVVVHVRMRPFNRSESEKGSKSSIARFDTDTNLVCIYKDKNEGIKSKFYFDSLFNEDVSQEQVYETAGRRVVDSVLKGFNGTIFAYGQTGTGKTFTMLGDYLSKGSNDSKMGIIPRALTQIFSESNTEINEFDFDISVSFIQIYMEMIQDLLEPSNTEIRIREDLVNGVYVSGVVWTPVKNVQQAMKVFAQGEKNRATSFTKLNAHSSRSHAVFMVKIEK